MSKIPKKAAKDKINQFKSINEYNEEYLSDKEIKLTFVGELGDSDMSKNNGFNKKQLEQLQELLKPIHSDINDFKTDFSELKQDVSQLKTDVTELKQDVSLIKSCPTIKKEINESLSTKS